MKNNLRARTGGLQIDILYFSVLTHYTGLLVAVLLAIYVGMHLFLGNYSKRIRSLWMLSQLGVSIPVLILSFTHIPTVLRYWKNGSTNGYLSFGHPRFPLETSLQFCLRATRNIFDYAFIHYETFFIFLFLLGVLFSMFPRGLTRKRIRYQLMGLISFLSLAFALIYALLGVYPLTGTRHSIYLLPFLVLSVSYALARMMGSRVELSHCLGVILILGILWKGNHNLLNNHRPFREHRREQLTLALSYTNARSGNNHLIVISRQLALTMERTLGLDVPEAGRIQRRGSKFYFINRDWGSSPRDVRRIRVEIKRIGNIETVWFMGYWIRMDRWIKKSCPRSTPRVRTAKNFGVIQIRSVSLEIPNKNISLSSLAPVR